MLTGSKFVLKNLSWFLANKGISIEAALSLPTHVNNLIKILGNNSLEICENFGIPKDCIFAPIYTGYKKYYSTDFTEGEHYDLLNLKPKF